MARHPWIRSSQYPDRWTAVYRLYDANDRLLYVGIGYDYLARWKAHAKKDWWSQVARKDVIWYDNRLTAAWEETKAILTENPVYNDHPGLELVSLIVIRARDRFGRWFNVAEPEMVTGKFWQERVIRQVEWNEAHAAIGVEDDVPGMMVPWEWYKRACVAMGEPDLPAQIEAQVAAEWAAQQAA